MTTYRVYYCALGGKRFASYDFDADSDDAALARARTLGRLKAPLFELCKAEVVIHRETSEQAS
jgi:hypothetical protein